MASIIALQAIYNKFASGVEKPSSEVARRLRKTKMLSGA